MDLCYSADNLAEICFFTVHDLPPARTNSASDPTTLRRQDGRVANFVLPNSSGFIYKWAAPL